MATVKDNELQMPAASATGATQADPALAGPGPVPEGDAGPFRRGRSSTSDFIDAWRRRFGGWAEENPGQMVAVGLVAGFVLGKVFRRSRRIELEID